MRSFLKVPQKVHHALLIVADLAGRRDSDTPISLAEIAERSGLSRGFLEEIAAPLRTAGIIEGKRGAGGGYRLAKDPATVTVGDIIQAIEGPLALVDCFDDKIGCALAPLCATQNVWQKVQHQVVAVLSDMTIADIAAAPVAIREAVV